MDIQKLQDTINQFVQERDWDQFHSVKNLSMALNVEAAELLEIFQWLPESASDQVGQDPLLKQKVEDELADIFYYLLRMAGKTGIDLESAFFRKMQQNAAKYPVALARGSIKKYTEL